MPNTSQDQDRPPKDFQGWKAEDYERDLRACEVRNLCIEAIRTLVAHQRGSASERDGLEGSLEHLQGRFISLGIYPGMHNDKWTYYPTESPRAMAECRASELSKYCGVGMPSQDGFLINLEETSFFGDGEIPVGAVVKPTPEVVEFTASQMYLTIAASQLDAEAEIFGA